jgi:hypothetical protein
MVFMDKSAFVGVSLIFCTEVGEQKLVVSAISHSAMAENFLNNIPTVLWHT